MARIEARFGKEMEVRVPLRLEVDTGSGDIGVRRGGARGHQGSCEARIGSGCLTAGWGQASSIQQTVRAAHRSTVMCNSSPSRCVFAGGVTMLEGRSVKSASMRYFCYLAGCVNADSALWE
jgi:hypothetical protein